MVVGDGRCGKVGGLLGCTGTGVGCVTWAVGLLGCVAGSVLVLGGRGRCNGEAGGILERDCVDEEGAW
jgi:hypothetical protein